MYWTNLNIWKTFDFAIGLLNLGVNSTNPLKPRLKGFRCPNGIPILVQN